MIEIYYKDNSEIHNAREECKTLIEYVEKRIDSCPFVETKTYCNNCKVHCYKKEMRERIKDVMRYSGPRMIFHHPLILLDHLYQGLKYKFQNRENKSIGKRGKKA